MITILKGDHGSMDFAGPIEMTELEMNKFIAFLKTLFNPVMKENVNSFRFERLGSKSFSKEWENEEYQLLLDLERDNEEVSKYLGRSWMSIEMKRMYYIPEMMEFAKKKGINLFKASKAQISALVDGYMKEHKEELTRRKEERVEERREIREAKELIEGFSKREDELKFLISIGKAKKEALESLKKEKEEAEIKLTDAGKIARL